MGMKINEEKLYEPVNAAATIAREILESVSLELVDYITKSSPVWSGSYMASHRASVGETKQPSAEPWDDRKEYSLSASLSEFGVGGLPFPDRISDEAAIALEEEINSKLKDEVSDGVRRLKDGIGVVTIYNNTPYADKVEFGDPTNNCGDPNCRHPVPAYAVYSGAFNDIETFAKAEIAKAIAKYKSNSTLKLKIVKKTGARTV